MKYKVKMDVKYFVFILKEIKKGLQAFMNAYLTLTPKKNYLKK